MSDFSYWFYEVVYLSKLHVGEKILLSMDDFTHIIENYWGGMSSLEQSNLLIQKEE